MMSRDPSRTRIISALQKVPPGLSRRLDYLTSPDWDLFCDGFFPRDVAVGPSGMTLVLHPLSNVEWYGLLYHDSKRTPVAGDCHVLRVDLTETHPTRVQAALRKLAQGTLSDTDVVKAAKAVSAGVVGRALARNAAGAVVLHGGSFSTLAYFGTGPMYEVLGAAREAARSFLHNPSSVEQLLEEAAPGPHTMRDYPTFPYLGPLEVPSTQDPSACPIGVTAPQHYWVDGQCKCGDVVHSRSMQELWSVESPSPIRRYVTRSPRR
jgi:hypothetical protein